MRDDTDRSTQDAAGASLWHAIRNNRFPAAFAEFFDDLPIERAELIEVGRDIDAAHRSKSHAGTAKKLNRLGVKLARRHLQHDESDDPQVSEFIESIFNSANNHTRMEIGHNVPFSFKFARMFGVVIGAVQLAMDLGATLLEADAIADAMAEMVPRVLGGEGLSATDARNAISYFTRTAPLSHWLVDCGAPGGLPGNGERN